MKSTSLPGLARFIQESLPWSLANETALGAATLVMLGEASIGLALLASKATPNRRRAGAIATMAALLLVIAAVVTRAHGECGCLGTSLRVSGGTRLFVAGGLLALSALELWNASKPSGERET